jgi:hypothetical protein
MVKALRSIALIYHLNNTFVFTFVQSSDVIPEHPSLTR